MNSEFSLSNLLNQTLAELSDNARLIAIFCAISIPITGISLLFEGGDDASFGFNMGFRITESLMEQGIMAVFVIIAAAAVSVVLTFWLYAGMVRRTTALDFARFWPWLGIYILGSLGIGFGLILLIIPGIILLVRWMIILPLVIATPIAAMDTFGESWARTRGHGWSIFGALVILLIGMIVLSSILGVAMVSLGGVSSIPGMLLSAVADALYSVVMVAFAVAAYRLLKDDREMLAEVFE